MHRHRSSLPRRASFGLPGCPCCVSFGMRLPRPVSTKDQRPALASGADTIARRAQPGAERWFPRSRPRHPAQGRLSATVMVRPPSGLGRASRCAWCASAMATTMDSPRPAPCAGPVRGGCRRRNGSKSSGTRSAGTRGPVLLTDRPAAGEVRMRTRPPGSGVAANAYTPSAPWARPGSPTACKQLPSEPGNHDDMPAATATTIATLQQAYECILDNHYRGSELDTRVCSATSSRSSPGNCGAATSTGPTRRSASSPAPGA